MADWPHIGRAILGNNTPVDGNALSVGDSRFNLGKGRGYLDGIYRHIQLTGNLGGGKNPPDDLTPRIVIFGH